jgi:excisionase family DNA binding protein
MAKQRYDGGQVHPVPVAASRLSVEVCTVRKWIWQKKIGIVRLGRAVRIPEAEISRLLTEGYRPACGE